MTEKRFLVDVGMRGLPFPLRVSSKLSPDGQFTVGNISITARIMREFEAGWIDKFIQVLHSHRERIGTHTLRVNILDYMKQLEATTVKIDFEYPFFIEKLTPVAHEKCLVRYMCRYSAKASSLSADVKVMFRIEIPAITTYPVSSQEKPGGLFGQLSIATVEAESVKEVYPEDFVAIVDRCALVPVYSFLTEQDQTYVIERVHSVKKTSVVMTDEIKEELRRMREVDWYAVSVSNFGMLHTYSTVIGTEKSMWVPFSGYED